jgi:hypothetical protein
MIARTLKHQKAQKIIMKNWTINNRLYFIGAALGAIAGFLYWKYVGCLTGTCSITSNPVNSTLYFALLGSVLFGAFKKQPKTTATDNQ